MDFFKSVPFFGELPENQLAEIRNIAVLRKINAGSVIFSPFEEADGFYMLKKGSVKVYKSKEGREKVIKIFKPPAIFGEASVLSGENFPAWAQAMQECEVFFIPRDSFIKLIRKHPDIGISLMAIMSKRLICLTKTIENLTLRSALSRVASYILEHERGGKLTFKTSVVALELNLTEETVSRMLSKLRKLAVIEKKGSLLKILDMEKLQELAL